MSQGHYFDADPACPSPPGEVELDLPGFHARLHVDRGVFSALRHRPRHPPAPPGHPGAAGSRRSAGPGVRLRPHCLHARPPRPGGRCGRSTSTTGPSPSPPATPRPWGWHRYARPGPRLSPTTSAFAGIWSNPPIRVGKAPLHDSSGSWLPRLGPAARPGWWSTGTSAPTPWRPGWQPRAGRSPGRHRNAVPHPLGGAGREAAGSDRPEAPAPGVEPPHRQGGWRCSSTASNRRTTSAPSSAPRPPSGSSTSISEGAPCPRPPQGRQAVDGHRALPVLVDIRTRPGGGRFGPGGRLLRGRPGAGRRRHPPAPAAAPAATCAWHRPRGPRASPATLAACDAVAFLPKLGRVGSLNVATATAIAVYELRRQAWAQ